MHKLGYRTTQRVVEALRNYAALVDRAQRKRAPSASLTRVESMLSHFKLAGASALGGHDGALVALGFVQGVLFAERVLHFTEIVNHNRKGEVPAAEED